MQILIIVLLMFACGCKPTTNQPDIEKQAHEISKETSEFVREERAWMDRMNKNTGAIIHNAASSGWEMRDKGASLNDVHVMMNRIIGGDTNALIEWRKSHP